MIRKQLEFNGELLNIMGEMKWFDAIDVRTDPPTILTLS